jgi:hypothetical protein
MNIGLIDVDCHAEKKKRGATIYPNLALCKISAWHKAHGDTVSWATIFEHYDILYMSKIFNFTPDDYTPYNADTVIKGGTGYDIESHLPDEIDRMQPDYDIYPNIPSDTAYGFLTRGCPNKCKWCVVPKKEGNIRPYMDIDEVATETRRKVVLMDNNILAAGDYCIEQFRKIIDRGYAIDFNQALDARLVTDEYARLLAMIKWKENRIRFGCDTIPQIEECEKAITLINSYGYKGEYFLYTMIQGDLQKDYARIHYWWKRLQENRKHRNGGDIYAYAQPFRDPVKKNIIPQWQKDMANWCNKRMIFYKCDFMDFEPRKGFKCKEYFY